MARKSRARRSKRRGTILGGKGGYFDKSKAGEVTAIGKALRYLGGLGGGALAPYAGAPPTAGSAVGTKLAAHLSKWLGYGAYTVSRNSLMSSSNATIPMMHSSGQSVIVRHREYVGDIRSSQAYAKQLELPLNPGSSSTFPWLSTVARQYQEYTWRGMVFHYIPTVGEAVSTTVPAYGNVMMHTEYRVTAPAPSNKAELLNEYFASDARPCESFIHPIECDPKENPYNVQYVRRGSVPVGEDPKTYDLGMFRAYTQGQGADGVIMGEIWVTYEVELRKPQLTQPSGEGTMFVTSQNLSTSTPLGTNPTFRANDLGITLINDATATTSTLAFPAYTTGKFLVCFAFSNNTGNCTLSGLTTQKVGLTPINWVGGSTGIYPQINWLPTAIASPAFHIECVEADGAKFVELIVRAATETNFISLSVAILRLPGSFT